MNSITKESLRVTRASPSKPALKKESIAASVGGASADQDGCDGGGKGAWARALDPLGQGCHGVISRSAQVVVVSQWWCHSGGVTGYEGSPDRRRGHAGRTGGWASGALSVGRAAGP